MRCPQCKNKILQKAGDIVRLRADGPVEFTADGKCKTKCHWCKAEIEVPLSLDPDIEIQGERFIIPAS